MTIKPDGLYLIRTIDKQRILKDLGKLSKSEIKEVKAIIKETFVD